MAFYFRKSFRLGPLRFNLSKGGVSASVGKRGFLVGRRADGKDYVAAGREGFYYRSNLDSGRSAWVRWALAAALVGALLAWLAGCASEQTPSAAGVELSVAILDDGSGDGGPPDPLSPVE